MKLASGVAPVPTHVDEKVFLGLGTDGAASNNDLNMWEEMDTVAKLHKVFTGDPKVISAQGGIRARDIRGAQRCISTNKIGLPRNRQARGFARHRSRHPEPDSSL
jgi:5-methylthioadenosine/S-adenosylhomocysteine deaminase